MTVIPEPYPFYFSFSIETMNDGVHKLHVRMNTSTVDYHYENVPGVLSIELNLEGLVDPRLSLSTIGQTGLTCRQMRRSVKAKSTASIESTQILMLPLKGELMAAFIYELTKVPNDFIYVNLPKVEHKNGKTLTTLKIDKSFLLKNVGELLEESGLDSAEHLEIISSSDQTYALGQDGPLLGRSQIIVLRGADNAVQMPFFGFSQRLRTAIASGEAEIDVEAEFLPEILDETAQVQDENRVPTLVELADLVESDWRFRFRSRPQEVIGLELPN